MYTNWKIAKNIINPKNINDEETRKKAEEAQNEYTEVAKWCNNTQEYHIKDIGDYYAVVKNSEPTQRELLEQELYQLQNYLKETDYITNKLAEIVDDMEAYKTMKAGYSEQLQKRAECRIRIREIKEETDDISDESGYDESGI